MRLLAPAKINWTLEVLGRRDDGYHEIRTVLQTIDLCDELAIEPADALRLEVEGEHAAREDDLVLRAAAALGAGAGRGALVRLRKRIPVAAGLGGGSSDASATLRGLNGLWGLRRSDQELAELAATLGSDVPFFLAGGSALAEGRGERVTPLPDAPPVWLALFAPSLELPDKTRRMYGALTPENFTDGSRTAALAERLRSGEPVRDEDMFNAFERVAYEMFEGLDEYRQALLAAGATSVHLAGAGPALFARGPDEAGAKAIRDKVSLRDGRLFVARTQSAER